MDQHVEKKGFGALFRLESLPLTLTSLLVFLIPFFFIPSSFVTLQIGKSALIFSFAIIAFCLYVISVLKKGSIRILTSKVMIAACGVLLATLIATIVSKIPSVSFLGYGFETGTFTSLLVFGVVLFLGATVFKSERHVFSAYTLFLLSVVILSLFHVVRLLFGVEWFSFGMFNTMASSPIGEWYDLGVVYGAAALLSLMSIEMLSLTKLYKVFAYIVFIASLLFLALIHFSFLWAVILCFAVVFFVYSLSFERVSNMEKKMVGPEGEVVHISKNFGTTRKFSLNTLIVLIISLIFLLPLGSVISNSFANQFGISNLAVRPSWTASTLIAKDSLAKNVLFGTGPNRFAYQWNISKSQDINTTPFWNLTFSTAIGYIPTFLTTTGFVGFVSWLIFLALFVYTGFVSLFARIESGVARYLTASSFFVALYFWVIAFCYVPGPAILTLTFFFTGIFFAVAHMQGVLRSKTITFSSYPKISFACVLGLVFLLVVGFGFLYLLTQKTVSAYYFEKGVRALRADAPVIAENNILKAISLSGHDVYYRELSALEIRYLATIVANITQPQVTDEVRAEFQRILGNAIAHTNLAIAYNSDDFENWVARGRVYEAVMPLGVDQAYEEAKRSYEEAQKRSPKNPALFLVLARLEATKQDFVKAKEYLAQALALKANYSDAIFLKSKIEVAQGDIKSAIGSVEKITFISPNDTGVFFELGLLKYNNKDYVGAAKAFERAVSLVPNYSNAKYFLGLSYQKLGRQQDAIKQFKDIDKLNPGNTEVALILKNLTEGRAPFTNAELPVDDKPENRDELPLNESEN